VFIELKKQDLSLLQDNVLADIVHFGLADIQMTVDVSRDNAKKGLVNVATFH
jgi:hypothetical protein